MSSSITELSKIYPGYKSASEAVRDSNWPRTTVQNAFNSGACKDAKRVCDIDKSKPNDKRLLFSNQDVRNMKWLDRTFHRHNVNDLKNIDQLRAQYSKPKNADTSIEPRSIAQPKETTAAVVEISSRRSRINERLWNIAAGFIIAGGIALGFIAFMVVVIGVAALLCEVMAMMYQLRDLRVRYLERQDEMLETWTMEIRQPKRWLPVPCYHPTLELEQRELAERSIKRAPGTYELPTQTNDAIRAVQLLINDFEVIAEEANA